MMITSICQYLCADELRRVNYPTQVLFFTTSRESNKIAVKKEKKKKIHKKLVRERKLLR